MRGPAPSVFLSSRFLGMSNVKSVPENSDCAGPGGRTTIPSQSAGNQNCVESQRAGVDIDSQLRPIELPFLPDQRDRVTILFGGLTWKHEWLIEGLLSGAGFQCKALPETDRTAHEVGKEYCASGLCNPAYFTIGNLIRYLQQLRAEGLTAA